MSTQSRDSRASAKGRRTVILAAVALVGASGVLGSLFYRQGQAARGNYAVAQQVVPDMAPALQEARLAKAKVLREKWRGWAQEHEGILKKMLSGGQSEQAVVWEALPIFIDDPKIAGITIQELNSGLSRYTWHPTSRGVLLYGDSSFTNEFKAEQRALIHENLNDHLEQYHDIKISMSQNAGSKTIGLWASGRITETETVGIPSVPGQPSSKEVTRELVAPYDFLS